MIGNFIEDGFIIISPPRSHGAPEKSSMGIKRDIPNHIRHGKPSKAWITRDKANIRIELELQNVH